MSADSVYLLVSRDVQRAELIARTLPPASRLQRIENPAMAPARLGGGGLAAVILDAESVEDALGFVSQYRPLAPSVRFLVLTGPEYFPPSNGVDCIAMTGDWVVQLAAVLNSEPRRAKIIGFIGAKGGCGTTTVALSVAHQLAESNEAILAEANDDRGGLRCFLNPPKALPAGSLWQTRSAPKLRAAFGVSPHADLRKWWNEPNYLVVDGHSGAAGPLDAAVLVVERERVCCEAAAIAAEHLSRATTVRQSGFVLVNKFPFAAPIPIEDFEQRLGLDLLAVIPPAADLCAAAVKQHVPVAAYDPSSAAARSLIALAKALA